MISDGLGYGITNLLTNSGSDKVEDYQLVYFQLGDTSGVRTDGDFYSLSGEFLADSEYGECTTFYVQELNKITNSDGEYESAYFARLKEGSVSNPALGYSKAQVLLDKFTANGKSIGEVGIFMKNPDGNLSKDRPVLVSYEGLETIIKTEDSNFIINLVIYDNQ